MLSRFNLATKQVQYRVVSMAVTSLAMLVAAFLTANDVNAVNSQLNQYITISPVSQDLRVDPGGQVTGKISVLNQGSDAFKLDMNVSPYRVEGVDYDPKYTRLPGTSDPSQWVAITDKPVDRTLDKGKIIDAKYTITVPKATQPGGYYVVIFAEASPTDIPKGKVAALNRVGQIVYITVNGEVKREGSATPGSLSPVTFGDTMDTSLLVKNTGGVHFKSEVKLTVRDLFGNVVHQAAQQRYILPQTERKIDLSWQAKNLIGIYKIDRSATLPSGKDATFSTFILMVHPLAAGIILVGIALLVIMIRRRRLSTKKLG